MSDLESSNRGSQLRQELWARLALTACALLPYWQFLTFDVLFVTDDYFTSDIWNAELPPRALWAHAISRGELPLWTDQLCSGMALWSIDPLSMAAFAALPLAVALDLVIVLWMLIASHGTYALARLHGATRSGAVLAGIGFAGSGYLACQLKHLAIVSTVVWIPLALFVLDRGLTATQRARRWAWLMGFAAIIGAQILACFPQSVHIAGLAYGAYALYRAFSFAAPPLHDTRSRARVLLAAGMACALGAAAGAITLLPLAELGSLSARTQRHSFAWSTAVNYWAPNFFTFLWPYINGDISDVTYRGTSLFWEDYGYVGGLTFALACYAIFIRRQVRATSFFLWLTVIAYLFVLGKLTPFYRVMYAIVPGLSLFRFPTRFLILVDLGLCILAAFGLSHLQQLVARKSALPRGPRLALLLGAGVCVLTALDLLIHQPRQNPVVDAAQWLATPSTAGFLRDQGPVRVITPMHTQFHRVSFQAARGWSDLRPYYRLREFLEPNANVYWNVPTATCYAGLTPGWYSAVWEDEARGGLVLRGVRGDMAAHELKTPPTFVNLLRGYGVTHVLSPLPVPALGAPLAGSGVSTGGLLIHKVAGSTRVRVVRGAQAGRDDRHAEELLTSPEYDPDHTVVLSDAGGAGLDAEPATPAPGTYARIEAQRSDEVVVRANAPAGGFLVLADTYYPGWTAQVDGVTTKIFRANISVRAVALTPGEHLVRFRYRPAPVRIGAAISGVAWLVIIATALWALLRARREVKATGQSVSLDA